MPVKVRADLKAVEKVVDDVKKRYRKEVTTGAIGYELIRVIQDLIRKGISPVDKYGRFQRYSDSYRKAIKKKWVEKQGVSPVNLKLTGEMLGSIRTFEKGEKLYLEFEDKKAWYHQDGTSKMPQRKLVPEEGETFTKRITQLLLKALKKAVKEK